MKLLKEGVTAEVIKNLTVRLIYALILVFVGALILSWTRVDETKANTIAVQELKHTDEEILRELNDKLDKRTFDSAISKDILVYKSLLDSSIMIVNKGQLQQEEFMKRVGERLDRDDVADDKRVELILKYIEAQTK